MASLTSVLVSRPGAFRELQPRGITIVEPGLVRGLAAALCALPNFPGSVLTCPGEIGASVRFSFVAGPRPFPPVTVQASGCRVVTGLGPVRSARSAAFWQTLSADLGGLASLPGPSLTDGIKP